MVLAGHHLNIGGETVTGHCLHLQISHDRRLDILFGRGRFRHNLWTVESVTGLQTHLLGDHGADDGLVSDLGGLGGFQHLSVGCRHRHRHTSLVARWVRDQLLLWQAPTPIAFLEKGSLRLILKLLCCRNGMIHNLHLSVCLRHQVLLVQQDLWGL